MKAFRATQESTNRPGLNWGGLNFNPKPKTIGNTKIILEKCNITMFSPILLYISKIKVLGRYLTQKRKITRFEDAKAIDLNLFLAQYNNKYTLNVTSYVVKKFYAFLNLPELTTNFRLYPIQPEQITPSETLTPEEVIKLANEASKRRELFKTKFNHTYFWK